MQLICFAKFILEEAYLLPVNHSLTAFPSNPHIQVSRCKSVYLHRYYFLSGGSQHCISIVNKEMTSTEEHHCKNTQHIIKPPVIKKKTFLCCVFIVGRISKCLTLKLEAVPSVGRFRQSFINSRPIKQIWCLPGTQTYKNTY